MVWQIVFLSQDPSSDNPPKYIQLGTCMLYLSWLRETWIAIDEGKLVVMALPFPNGQGLDCLELLRLAPAVLMGATTEGVQPLQRVASIAKSREGMPS